MWRLLFFSVFRAAAFHGLMLACMYPEMMDGRVKTLHPRVRLPAFLFVFADARILLRSQFFQVAGSLLAIRSSPAHVESMSSHGIIPTDLLVRFLCHLHYYCFSLSFCPHLCTH